MKLSKGLREFIELLNSRKIKYLLVGGHAVAYHGLPRFTEDIDFLIDTSAENAALIATIVKELGFQEFKPEDFQRPETVIQLGRAPNRIDLLTSATGISFEEAWKTRLEAELDGLSMWMISKELLIKNKLATGRQQDLADADRIRKQD